MSRCRENRLEIAMSGNRKYEWSLAEVCILSGNFLTLGVIAYSEKP